MRTRRNRSSKPSDSNANPAEGVLKLMYEQGKAQFGDAVKSFWLYEGDLCPACLQNTIGAVNFKGQEGLAVNGFMYRERGVLIGYFLCGTCAEYIHAEAKKNPYKQTPMHADIESNLIVVYQKHLMSLDA